MEKHLMKYLVCLAFNKPREVLSFDDMHKLLSGGYIKNGEITDKGRVLVDLIAAAAKE